MIHEWGGPLFPPKAKYNFIEVEEKKPKKPKKLEKKGN